ncbi:SMI1/KNR4 family protein [Bacillus massiliigorillae]|uniref:SMI1/KNR4 family protein n=1 Tax=Bacillus massiliigorillae TaxID=1243664 RepID=UPI0003A6EF26|nr:SMI1/KNR4 family protein [Bacillus massiliigorillae]
MLIKELITSAQELIQRSGCSTRVATQEEICEINEKLGKELPSWLVELMTTIPICESRLLIPIEDEDYNIEIDFLSPKLIIEESTLAVPGCAVLNSGYICIGLVINLSNPIAINIDEGCNPTIYVLDHDYGEETDLIIENREPLAMGLSELFTMTLIEQR